MNIYLTISLINQKQRISKQWYTIFLNPKLSDQKTSTYTKLINCNIYVIRYNYVYDADNRLEYSNGYPNNSNSRCQYEFKMDYSPSGKIQYKNINSTVMKNGTTINDSYGNEYMYNKNDNPYAVTDKYKSHIKSSYKYFLNEENRGKK